MERVEYEGWTLQQVTPTIWHAQHEGHGQDYWAGRNLEEAVLFVDRMTDAILEEEELENMKLSGDLPILN